ncbi:MAG: hypothetical protein U1A27_02970 [Phycisphaerae bacterium]
MAVKSGKSARRLRRRESVVVRRPRRRADARDVHDAIAAARVLRYLSHSEAFSPWTAKTIDEIAAATRLDADGIVALVMSLRIRGHMPHVFRSPGGHPLAAALLP